MTSDSSLMLKGHDPQVRRIQNMWLEFEQWAPGQWNSTDDNSDVHVTLSDGSTWVATFFTYQNSETLRKKNRESGECLAGAYFWATDLILIDDLSRPRIQEVVEHLIAEQEFDTVFVRTHVDDEES